MLNEGFLEDTTYGITMLQADQVADCRNEHVVCIID